MNVTHTRDITSNIYLDAVSLRQTVFIKEQGVPKEIELDEHEHQCIHLVLYSDQNIPIATCRLFPIDSHTIKLQRMAVDKKFRGQAYGRFLIDAAEKVVKMNGFQAITLGAQVTALGFYEKLGYTKFGEPFLSANINHYQMNKIL